MTELKECPHCGKSLDQGEWKPGDGFEYEGTLFMVVETTFFRYLVVSLTNGISVGDYSDEVDTFTLPDLIKHYENPVRIPRMELLKRVIEEETNEL